MIYSSLFHDQQNNQWHLFTSVLSNSLNMWLGSSFSVPCSSFLYFISSWSSLSVLNFYNMSFYSLHHMVAVSTPSSSVRCSTDAPCSSVRIALFSVLLLITDVSIHSAIHRAIVNYFLYFHVQLNPKQQNSTNKK